MANLRHFIPGLLLSLAAVIAADHSCYFPNGNLASGNSWTTCQSNYDGDAGAAPCCSQGDSCLSNGLCQQPNKLVYRGACSESSWGDDVGCPTYCRGGAFSLNGHIGLGPVSILTQACVVNTSTTAVLQQCSNDQYCCPTSGDCCKDTSSLFTINSAVSSTTPQKSSSSSDSSDHPSTMTTAVGAGVGGAVTILAIVFFMAWYRARRSRPHPSLHFCLRCVPSAAAVGRALGGGGAAPGEAPPPYESQKPEQLPSIYSPDSRHPSDKSPIEVGKAL